MKWLTTGKGGKKMNLITKNSEIARVFWDKYTDENSVAIDATCGNGNDTLYLCQRVKRVYGFDIQQVAIDNTAALLKENSIDAYDKAGNLLATANESSDYIDFAFLNDAVYFLNVRELNKISFKT